MTTPAQAYGHPTLDDVPVQGPTDPGIRAADCWYAQNVLPSQKASSCVDCTGGIVPMWTRQTLSGVRGQYSGIGGISRGGIGVQGFLHGPYDDVWTTLGPAQQAWIADTMRKLNDKIIAAGSPPCPQWNPSNITSVTSCFKQWFNANYSGKLTDASGKPISLSPTTIFDQQTLDALRTIVAMDPQGFPTPFPGTSLPGPAHDEKKYLGLSKGQAIGAGAGVLALGGLLFAATRGKKRR